MRYENITKGIFLKRPNRFLAHVAVNKKELICHVKNTGRCRELLVPGAEVGLVFAGRPGRKTDYDLVSVKKQGRWVNMDSQMVNEAAEEWLKTSGIFPENAVIRREVSYGKSRFDFYIEESGKKIFLEVKGVTLEEKGIARFPDAPTERGIKHIEELMACRKEDFEAWILFVIQMKEVFQWRPNWKTHREFGEALLRAREAGVKILAMDCQVEMDSIFIDQPVQIVLEEE